MSEPRVESSEDGRDVATAELAYEPPPGGPGVGVGILVLKVAAIFFAVWGVASLPTLGAYSWEMWNGGYWDWAWFIGTLAPPVIYAVVAVVLLTFTEPVDRLLGLSRAVPLRGGGHDRAGAWPVASLAAAAVAVIGLMWLLSGLSQCAQLGAALAAGTSPDEYTFYTPYDASTGGGLDAAQVVRSLLPALAEVAIGLVVMLKARRLGRWMAGEAKG